MSAYYAVSGATASNRDKRSVAEDLARKLSHTIQGLAGRKHIIMGDGNAATVGRDRITRVLRAGTDDQPYAVPVILSKAGMVDVHAAHDIYSEQAACNFTFHRREGEGWKGVSRIDYIHASPSMIQCGEGNSTRLGVGRKPGPLSMTHTPLIAWLPGGMPTTARTLEDGQVAAQHRREFGRGVQTWRPSEASAEEFKKTIGGTAGEPGSTGIADRLRAAGRLMRTEIEAAQGDRQINIQKGKVEGATQKYMEALTTAVHETRNKMQQRPTRGITQTDSGGPDTDALAQTLEQWQNIEHDVHEATRGEGSELEETVVIQMNRVRITAIAAKILPHPPVDGQPTAWMSWAERAIPHASAILTTHGGMNTVKGQMSPTAATTHSRGTTRSMEDMFRAVKEGVEGREGGVNGLRVKEGETGGALWTVDDGLIKQQVTDKLTELAADKAVSSTRGGVPWNANGYNDII